MNDLSIEQNEQLKKAKVISGFPGIGKSFLFNNNPNNLTLLDSDSSSFSWSNPELKVRNPDWPDNYIEHIIQNLDESDAIFVSSHQEVRQALLNSGVEFVLIYPSLAMKTEYIQRYVDRGSSEGFIRLLEENYETWINELMNQKGCIHIVLQPGEYLADVINEI